MLIYNTLSRKKEEFQPIDPPNVTMYVCGPTVYDFFHIGNARSFIMADIIRKYLIYKGFHVKYAMNITDIDDKIIKKSNEQNTESSKVAEEFTEAFLADTKRLNIAEADIFPRATAHIGEIINMIESLIKNEMAYNVDGNVFYDVSKFENYGKLSGKKLDELISGSRIEINDEKKNPLDFTLWKKAKEGEPFWESPWGKGRPGWHIECSAMSTKHLGETIDIHAGGSDLIFPHHENEIAQSEGATSHKFVKYWIHFGFLNLQNEKMSKSLGNFFTARDILKTYSAEVIRMLFSQTHYAGPLNFSNDLLDSAKKGLERLNNLVDLVNEKVSAGKSGEQIEFDFDRFYFGFENSMDDDFNTPQAVAVIFDFVKSINSMVSKNENIDVQFFIDVKTFLEKTAQNVLGIVNFGETKKIQSDSKENELIDLLIKIRTEAKQNKNFALADLIRDQLNEIGFQLVDTKSGTTFKKK
ncbi:MAG: cysteine--tRNA ligase [Ignavibacteriales bacterium]|nr:MAG: cysteine--tRNA ligase [Ignavibacteriales bacterium]